MDFKTKIIIVLLVLILILPWFIIKLILKILFFIAIFACAVLIIRFFVDTAIQKSREINSTKVKQALSDFFKQQILQASSKEQIQDSKQNDSSSDCVEINTQSV